MVDKPPLPYAESYWVVPGKLMAGEYPGTHEEELTRRRIIALLRCGVRAFIDLTQHAGSYNPYRAILEEEALPFNEEVTWKNFPIEDYAIPSLQLMDSILNEIDMHLTNGRMVYVHCLAGIGRTGTVVGCYLVRHGLTGDEALQQIKALRSDMPSWWERSPEGQDQVDFICGWEGRDLSAGRLA